jgi:hypothetical protein
MGVGTRDVLPSWRIKGQSLNCWISRLLNELHGGQAVLTWIPDRPRVDNSFRPR